MTINCPSCSAPDQEIGKFCENCGYFINEADAKASMAAQGAPTADPTPTPTTTPGTTTSTADPAPVITPVTGIVPPPASGTAPTGSAQFAIVVGGMADPAKGFT